VEVDSAPDAWVSASGSTTCLFSVTLSVQGGHKLTVRAQNVRPGDYDDSNNALSAHIDVLNPVIPVYTAKVQETTSVTVNTTDSYLSAASTSPDTHKANTITKVDQSRFFTGTIPNAVSLSQPLKFSYSDMSGGKSLSSVEYPGITLDSSGNFLDDDSANSGRLLCIHRSTDNGGSTAITLMWNGTETTTWSVKTCSSIATGCVGSDFTIGPAKPMNVPLANDYSANVVLDDGTPYSAQPTMALTPFGSSTLTNIVNRCNRPSGVRTCLISDVATYGKSGAVSVGGQTASLQ
jgi:hypothetical protein